MLRCEYNLDQKHQEQEPDEEAECRTPICIEKEWGKKTVTAEMAPLSFPPRPDVA